MPYRALSFALLSSFSLLASTPQPSSEEVISLRRIVELWREKNLTVAKSEILQFLDEFPKSSMKDNAYAMLGDLYFHENQYENALTAFNQIRKKEIRDKTFVNRIHTLYELKQYENLIDATVEHFKVKSPLNQDERNKVRFLFAQGVYRHALTMEDSQKLDYYLDQSKKHFEPLLKTKYARHCWFPLASIARHFKEYPEAVSYYLEIAKNVESKQEEFLFEAASLQMLYDKSKAIDTFETVANGEGKRAGLARYDQMVLLFQEERYADLLKISDEEVKKIPEDKLHLVQLYRGRSYFFLAEFASAARLVEEYLISENEDLNQTKTALLTILSCASELHDFALFEKHFMTFGKLFPQDEEYPKTCLLHAEMAISAGGFEQAAADFERLIKNFPGVSWRAQVMYDYALLLLQMQKWVESRDQFLSYLIEFPEGSEVKTVWRNIAHCSLQEFKTNPDSSENRFRLSADLETVLKQEEVLNPHESQEYRLLLITTLYNQGKYEKAAGQLEMYIDEFSDHPSIKDAEMMLAFSLYQSTHDKESFIEHAEKALVLNPESMHTSLLHLKLYNVYLMLENYDAAAAHLFETQEATSLENQIWLASFYYEKAKSDPVACERSKRLYEKLFASHFDEDSKIALLLEPESLKWAELLTSGDEKLRVLQQVAAIYKKFSKSEWKYERLVLFELAKCYEMNQEFDEALKTYEELIVSASFAPSYVSKEAILRKARLQFQILEDKNSSEVTAILRDLKDLQIKKNIESEPLHIEAAIDYAKIKIELADDAQKQQLALDLFTLIKQDFSTPEYDQARKLCPEKEALFIPYLQFVEAEILKISAKSDEKVQ